MISDRGKNEKEREKNRLRREVTLKSLSLALKKSIITTALIVISRMIGEIKKPFGLRVKALDC